jgi:hypothetical protein
LILLRAGTDMSPRAWPAKLAWALSAAVIALALTAVAGASAATGSWERAWGKDVDAAQGGTGFELCVVAASCRAGTLGELLKKPFARKAAVLPPTSKVISSGRSNH